MNTCNSINSLALGKLLKKYNLSPKNKQKIILLAQRKTATWSGLHRKVRQLEFQQTVSNPAITATTINAVRKPTKINSTSYGLTSCRKHFCWWNHLLY